MLLLAFDTATPAVTVGLADGGTVLAEHTTVDARRHGELLAPGVSHVLTHARVSRADLGGVAVGVGPGPFTGLRVGLVTAKALGAALDIPVYGVCSLDVVAAESGLEGECLVATDARRREVYWARYRAVALDVQRVEGPHVSPPADVRWQGPSVGGGAALYPEHFPDAREPAFPSGASMARLVAHRLAGGGELLDPIPLYLRRPDAAAPGPRKRVTA